MLGAMRIGSIIELTLCDQAYRGVIDKIVEEGDSRHIYVRFLVSPGNSIYFPKDVYKYARIVEF